jgi:hypothetical protein
MCSCLSYLTLNSYIVSKLEYLLFVLLLEVEIWQYVFNRHIFVVTCLSEALVMPSFLPRDLLGRSQSLLILIFASVVSRDRYYWKRIVMQTLKFKKKIKMQLRNYYYKIQVHVIIKFYFELIVFSSLQFYIKVEKERQLKWLITPMKVF